MTDIVNRLRGLFLSAKHMKILLEAAEEIERLRAERDRWRKIADALYEANSNRSAHSEVAEAYGQEARRD